MELVLGIVAVGLLLLICIGFGIAVQQAVIAIWPKRDQWDCDIKRKE